MYCLNEHNILGVAGSWARGEIYGAEAYESFVKGNGRLAASGRNARGSAVHTGQEIEGEGIEILTVRKDVMLVVKRSGGFQCTGVLVSYVTPQNHRSATTHVS